MHASGDEGVPLTFRRRSNGGRSPARGTLGRRTTWGCCTATGRGCRRGRPRWSGSARPRLKHAAQFCVGTASGRPGRAAGRGQGRRPLPRGAEQGRAMAQYNLGVCYPTTAACRRTSRGGGLVRKGRCAEQLARAVRPRRVLRERRRRGPNSPRPCAGCGRRRRRATARPGTPSRPSSTARARSAAAGSPAGRHRRRGGAARRQGRGAPAARRSGRLQRRHGPLLRAARRRPPAHQRQARERRAGACCWWMCGCYR